MFHEIKVPKLRFITLKVRMFKNNLSPLNHTKDKYINENFLQHNNNQVHHAQNQLPLNYHYTKSPYPQNYNKYQSGLAVNYQTPLSPLSLNIGNNPMSPVVKIKMFSNKLNMNKKNSANNNQNIQGGYQNTQDTSMKENKIFGKIGPKNQIFDLTQSIDLKCDQVLEDSQLKVYHRKQTPQSIYEKQSGCQNKTKLNYPILKFESKINDDLKCDQILDIKKGDSHQESKRSTRFTTNYHNQPANDLESNPTYLNQMNRIVTVRTQNCQKVRTLGPLTPNYQRIKTTALLVARRETENQSQGNDSSNPKAQIATPCQQKSRSFTNILTPQEQSKKLTAQQNSEEQNQQIPETSLGNSPFEQLSRYLQRTTSLLQMYRNKLQQVQQKNTFLQKQNLHLRKYITKDQGSNITNIHHHNTPGSTRYQGIN